MTQPDGTRLTWYTYDLRNMTAAGKADGLVSHYWYDLSGNLIEKAEPTQRGDIRRVSCDK